MMATERDASFSGIGDAIDKYLRSHGLLRVSRESLVPLAWAEIVGDWYRRHTVVLRVEGGVVTVRCDSAARAQQLQLDSARIIAALNERLGQRTVREIRPSSGGISRRDAPTATEADTLGVEPTGGELDLIELEPEARDYIAAQTAGISDDALRELAARVVGRSHKVRRWRQVHGYRPCRGCGALLPPGQALCKACDPGRRPQQGSSDVLTGTWDPARRTRRQDDGSAAERS